MLPSFIPKPIPEKEHSMEDSQLQPSKKKPPGFSLEQSEGTDVTHTSLQTEPIQNQQYVLNEHLFLMNFKTMECGNKLQHSYKTCLFYHNSKDRRRFGNFYSNEMCEFAEKDQVELCPLEDKCPKCHNRLEQLYKPDKYKKKFCSFYPSNLHNCEYGKYCSFAHSESEILIELIHNYEYDEDFYLFHYKTVWCPFNLAQHDKVLCVYAHNWQDYRRKPHIKNYEPFLCLSWKHKDIILNYEDAGCPNNENCNRCHGWKENEYHPLNYKVKPCSSGFNCTKGSLCPYFHSHKDRRIVSVNIQSTFFRFYPRNRIISNTFKVRASSFPLKNAMPSSPSKNTSFTPRNLITVAEETERNQKFEKKLIQLTVTDYEQIKARKTVEEKPHKRLSFLDEESLRRRSDSKMLDNGMAFVSSKFSPQNPQFLYPFYKTVSTPIEKPKNFYEENKEGGDL